MKNAFRSRRQPHQAQTHEESAAHTPFFSKSHDASIQKKQAPFFTASGGQVLQTKLTIGQPGDKFEKEADAVANAVVNQSSASPVAQRKEISAVQRAALASPAEDEKLLSTAEGRMEKDKLIQNKPEKEEEKPVQMQAAPEEEEPVQMQAAPEEEEPVQMQAAPEEEEPVQTMAEEEEEPVQAKSDSSASPGASLGSRLSNSKGKGNPLPAKTRGEMESAIGANFKGVRLHSDQEAVEMNHSLRAQAFTNGQDIYFNSGKLNPETSEGKRLLAHELTHVVQQGEGEIQRKPEDETRPRTHIGEEPEKDSLVRHQGSGSTWCDEPTGTMQTQVTEHCAGTCVAQHENVHVQDDASCCRRVARCLRRAGGNAARRTGCLDAYHAWLPLSSDRTECNAYRHEVPCLTRLIRRGCRRGGAIPAACCGTLRAELAHARTMRTTHCGAARTVRCPFGASGRIR